MIRVMTAVLALFAILLIMPSAADAARRKTNRSHYQRRYDRGYNRGYRQGRRYGRRDNSYRNHYWYDNRGYNGYRYNYGRNGYGVSTPNFGFYIR